VGEKHSERLWWRVLSCQGLSSQETASHRVLHCCERYLHLAGAAEEQISMGSLPDHESLTKAAMWAAMASFALEYVRHQALS